MKTASSARTGGRSNAIRIGVPTLILLLGGCSTDSSGGNEPLTEPEESAEAASADARGEGAAESPQDSDDDEDEDGVPGDNPEDEFADPPRFDDWECPAGIPAKVIGEGKTWQHSVCDPFPGKQ